MRLRLMLILLAVLCVSMAYASPKASSTPKRATNTKQTKGGIAEHDLAARMVEVAKSKFEAGKHEAADKLLQAALELDPDNQKAQYYLGLVAKCMARGKQSKDGTVGLWYPTIPPRPASK